MTDTAASVPVPDDLNWQHLHPVTPLLRSWAVLAALVFVIFRQVADAGSDDSQRLVLSNLGIVGGGIGLVVLISAAGLWWSWRRYTYAYDDKSLYIRSGIVARNHRTVRLDRVQSITVVQPLAARIFGFAKLTFEVAGGAGSSAELGFLRDDAATTLRTELLARAAGLKVDAEVAAPEAPERVVFAVPPKTAWGATLLSSGTFIGLIVVVGSVVAVIALGSVSLLVPMALGLFSIIQSIATRFGSTFGFVAATSPDGIRVRRGLLTATSQTLPPGRIQAVEFSQSLLWRKAGWWQVRVNVAGLDTSDAKGDSLGNSVLLPAGPASDAFTALWLVLPELAQHTDLLHAGMTGRSSTAGDPFVAAPARARFVDPWAWRRHGYVTTPTALLLRGGRWTRSLTVVPHERTQSTSVDQGPLQRRMRVASFVLHSTPGSVHPRVKHLDPEVIATLVTEQSELARRARSTATPEAWMLTEHATVAGSDGLGKSSAETVSPATDTLEDQP